MFAKRERAAGRGLVEDNGAFSSPEAAILLVSTREIAATIAASGDQMEEDIRGTSVFSCSKLGRRVVRGTMVLFGRSPSLDFPSF